VTPTLQAPSKRNAHSVPVYQYHYHKMADQTIGLPQLVLILLLGGLAIRFFFFSTNSGSQTRSSNSANNIRAREADVERIQQMFPQVSRRSIMWDLQRNGGNVVATTERILSGRGLEVVGPLCCRFEADPLHGLGLVLKVDYERTDADLCISSLRSRFNLLYQFLPLQQHP
jgi:hypothetical protein